MKTQTAAMPRYNPSHVGGFEQPGSKKLAHGKGADVHPKTGKELPKDNTNAESMMQLDAFDLELFSVAKMLKRYTALLSSGSAREASGIEMSQIRAMIADLTAKKKSVEADIKALQAKMNANKKAEQPEAAKENEVKAKPTQMNEAAKSKLSAMRGKRGI